jgi:hypothetical protein
LSKSERLQLADADGRMCSLGGASLAPQGACPSGSTLRLCPRFSLNQNDSSEKIQVVGVEARPSEASLACSRRAVARHLNCAAQGPCGSGHSHELRVSRHMVQLQYFT